jgi:hypothetical protein
LLLRRGCGNHNRREGQVRADGLEHLVDVERLKHFSLFVLCVIAEALMYRLKENLSMKFVK